MRPESNELHDLFSESANLAPPESPDAEGASQSKIISHVLSPAVRFWLRSQVEQVDMLKFSLQGGDRQILSGHIPSVAIAAQKAVYQGFHLSDLSVMGRNIRINLGQILRGKPLRLLEVVPIQVMLTLNEADLNASLSAPLMVQAMDELIALLSQRAPLPDAESLKVVQTQIEPEHLTLMLGPHRDRAATLALHTKLVLSPPNAIAFYEPQWFQPHAPDAITPLTELEGFVMQLGTDVMLHTLRLDHHHLYCEGIINVVPV